MQAARDAHALLAEMGRLLGELEALVAPLGEPLAPPPAGTPAASLSAGPFSALHAVDAFAAELRGLQHVIDVVHRGFEGDRALFDVRLGVRR